MMVMPKEINAMKSLLTLTKKNFIVTFFSGKGAGGQHRNKHKNCVRISHPGSGVTGIGTEQKSRTQNRKIAFKRLTDNLNFKAWLKIKSIHEEELQARVKEAMLPENLKIEVFEDIKKVKELM